jgi:glutaredoxin
MSSTFGDVIVYGREQCKLCVAAKDKLQMMEVPFRFELIDTYIAYHEGWREDHSVEILATYRLHETLPVIKIDGLFLSYPLAIKHLKTKLVQPKPIQLVKEIAVAVA